MAENIVMTIIVGILIFSTWFVTYLVQPNRRELKDVQERVSNLNSYLTLERSIAGKLHKDWYEAETGLEDRDRQIQRLEELYYEVFDQGTVVLNYLRDRLNLKEKSLSEIYHAIEVTQKNHEEVSELEHAINILTKQEGE